MNVLPYSVASLEQVFELVNVAFTVAKQPRPSERRIVDRETAYLPIEIQGLDEQFRATGAAFDAITRDISYAGLGVISSQPLDEKKAVIKLLSIDQRETPILVRILYCKQIGPMYLLGTRYCTDWDCCEQHETYRDSEDD